MPVIRINPSMVVGIGHDKTAELLKNEIAKINFEHKIWYEKSKLKDCPEFKYCHIALIKDVVEIRLSEKSCPMYCISVEDDVAIKYLVRYITSLN